MPLEDVKDDTQLKDILEGFITLEPLRNGDEEQREVIDTRREALTTLMMNSGRRKVNKASELIDTLKASKSSKIK